MLVELKPLDSVFFRDGRSFVAGEAAWANSLFPPYPSVFYGAFRTCYFANNMKEFSKANTLEDPTTKLKIGLSCLKNGNEIVLPVPRDLVGVKTHKGNSQECFLMNKFKMDCVSNYPLDYYLMSEEAEIEELSQEFIEASGFDKYTDTKYSDGKQIKKSFWYLKQEELIEREYKIGIGRSRVSGTAQKSMLYRIEAIRLKNNMREVSFLLEIDGLDIPNQGILKLGSDSKVEYRVVKDVELPQFYFEKTMNLGEKIDEFKIYLASPAIFNNGWFPRWINKDSMIGTYNKNGVEIELKLEAAIVGKNQAIGGFDMVKNKPKKMFKAVPSGSIYCFKVLKGTNAEILKAFNKTCISEERASEGFGYSIIGRV